MGVSGWFHKVGLVCYLSIAGAGVVRDSELESSTVALHTTVTASANYLNYQRSKDERKQHITAEFRPAEEAQGWSSAREAAVNFFLRNEQTYLEANEESELAGFLLVSDQGRYFYTNAVVLPSVFQLKARAFAPAGWKLGDFLHSHPPGNANQRHFSEQDRQAVRSSKRDYFLRGPDGDVRYMNRKLARTTKTPEGALGESVCPRSLPCLASHPRHQAILSLANSQFK